MSDSEKFDRLRAASAKREHGSRARYSSGCRCLICRAANSRYESERAAKRKSGQGNGLVGSERARAHILRLAKQGVGAKTVADAARTASSTIWKILAGLKTRIRAETERKILSVTRDAAGDGTLVDAAPTWRRIRELQEDGGFSKAEIARRLGRRSPALQIGKERVTLRTAATIERFWRYYLRRGEL